MRSSMPYESPLDPMLADLLSQAKPGAEDELTGLYEALAAETSSADDEVEEEPPPAWQRE